MKTSFWKLLSCLGVAAGLAFAGMPKAAAQCGLPINPSNSTLIHPQAGSTPATNAASADFDDHHGDDDASIVGLWHVEFLIDNQMVQEAFQIWNVGGTEVHNPNIPLGGGVCLGTWKQVGRTFQLAHRVWNYDPATGDFLGVIHLREVITVGNHGDSHNGTFTEDFYDPNGNFQSEVAGTVVGTRISVE